MAIFGGYTGARVAPLPAGFMAAAQTSATNLQKGLASMGEGIGDALKQYGKNKDERDLLEGDIDAIKQIVESDPMRYIDVARDETNIKKFSEVPDMSLSKLRAYSSSLRTQMAAVDRRDAQSIQDLQRQELQSKADDRSNYAAALTNRPGLTDPEMQTQYGTKTVLPVKPNEAGALGWFAADRPEEYSAAVLKPGAEVPVVSEGQETMSPKDFREFYGGMAARVKPGIAEAIGRFGEGAKRLFDPAVGMGKSLGALAQVPGAPALEGYFQPEYEGIRATGPGGAPTPEDIARLDYNRSERERMKGRYPQHVIDEMLPPLKVEETPLYVPRDKGDAPGSMIQKDGINTRTGLPDLTRYAGETSDLRIPGDTSKAPTGYWTGLAQDGKMPTDGYTVTADGKKTLSDLWSIEDQRGIPSVERLLELNPHLEVFYDSTGRVQPDIDSVPPAGTKILLPNETLEIDVSTGAPINVSRYRDPEVVAAEEAEAAVAAEAKAASSGSFGERLVRGVKKFGDQYQQQQAALEAEMTAPPPAFPFEQRQTSKEVKIGDRDVTWKDAHARMIQSLVDDGQQITPALSKSLEAFAKTQYAAEEVGLTIKDIGTDSVMVFQDGKFIGQSKKQVVGSTRAIPITVTGPDGEQYRSGKARTPDGEVVDDPFVTEAGEEDSSVDITGDAGTFKGNAKTKQEAVSFRKQYVAASESVPLLDRLIEVAKEGQSDLWGPKKAEVQALQNILVGKLRIALTGGGPLTKEEREMIKSAIRDPLAYFSTAESNVASLEAVKKSMLDAVKASADAQGLEQVGGPLQPGAGVGTSRNYTNDPRLKKKK